MIFIFLVVFVVALFTPWTWAAEEEDQDLPAVIEEEVWIVFVDEPGGYFLDARETFLNGDRKEAAHSIKKGAALIKLESYRADKEAKKALRASAKELEKLAKAVEKGSFASGASLEEAFTRAEYALAWHHYLKALDYEAKNNYEKMAYAVDAAATHLLSAWFWADEDLEEMDAVATKKHRSVVREMINGGTWAAKKLGEAVKGLGRGIQNLGKKVKPAKERPED